MAQQKQPAIVAELGRPETPEETAARKAENSRKHRANQTALNLVIAMIASLGIVLFLVAVVVRPAAPPSEGIDYVAIAADAQPTADARLIAPVLPGWGANDARFGTTAQVPTWYIGLITPGGETNPNGQFIALNQGIGANPSWQAAVLESAVETGTTTIDGLVWSIYDQRDADDPGNFAYAMATTFDDSTVVLHGTASDDEFEQLASAIAAGRDTP